MLKQISELRNDIKALRDDVQTRIDIGLCEATSITALALRDTCDSLEDRFDDLLHSARDGQKHIEQKPHPQQHRGDSVQG